MTADSAQESSQGRPNQGQCLQLQTVSPAVYHPQLRSCVQLLRSSLVNNRTQAKVAEELGMQEYAITNDKTKRPVALRTKTLADLLECESCFVNFSQPAGLRWTSRPMWVFSFSHSCSVWLKKPPLFIGGAQGLLLALCLGDPWVGGGGGCRARDNTRTSHLQGKRLSFFVISST